MGDQPVTIPAGLMSPFAMVPFTGLRKPSTMGFTLF